MARFIGSRKDLTEDKLEELEELVMDSTKAEAIFEAARVSMGEHLDSATYTALCRLVVRSRWDEHVPKTTVTTQTE